MTAGNGTRCRTLSSLPSCKAVGTQQIGLHVLQFTGVATSGASGAGIRPPRGRTRESKSAGREQGQEVVGRLTAGATYWYFDKRLIEEEDSLLELESGSLAGNKHASPPYNIWQTGA